MRDNADEWRVTCFSISPLPLCTQSSESGCRMAVRERERERAANGSNVVQHFEDSACLLWFHVRHSLSHSHAAAAQRSNCRSLPTDLPPGEGSDATGHASALTSRQSTVLVKEACLVLKFDAIGLPKAQPAHRLAIANHGMFTVSSRNPLEAL